MDIKVKSSQNHPIVFEDDSAITPFNQLDSKEKYDKVNVKVKVLQAKLPTMLDSGKRIQEVTVADGTGTSKCKMWEDRIGTLTVGKSYHLKQFNIQDYCCKSLLPPPNMAQKLRRFLTLEKQLMRCHLKNQTRTSKMPALWVSLNWTTTKFVLQSPQTKSVDVALNKSASCCNGMIYVHSNSQPNYFSCVGKCLSLCELQEMANTNVHGAPHILTNKVQ